MPLAKVAAAGVATWTCLSRDLDEGGVVQREDVLRKVLYELCGVLCAIDDLWPLRGALQLSEACNRALRSAQEEARHSMEQLLLTFEDAGLRQVTLPPLYQRVVAS